MISHLRIAKHATDLRSDMGIGDAEVIGDIVSQIRQSGYDYVQEPFGSDFSGFSQSLGNGRYLIGFNTSHFWSKSFRRFTISHELGHITIPSHRRILDSGGRHRSKSEFRSNEPIEREADYFAICFLAPKKAFQLAMKYKECTKETVLELSACFGISTYASVLRFIELTDLACTLLVCNKDGFIDYERRSNRMKELYQQDFLTKRPVGDATLTYDNISGRNGVDTCEIPLNAWFDGLPDEIKATESVIALEYNRKFLTLVVPHLSDLDVES